MSFIASKTADNEAGDGSQGTVSRIQTPMDRCLYVKVINDWWDDILRNNVLGRTTGFAGGYTEATNASFSSIMPGIPNGGFTPMPPIGGIDNDTPILIASTSVQDDDTGTGVWGMILFFMKPDLIVQTEFVFLSGTTPVALTARNIYHFMYGFPVYRGLSTAIVASNVTSNVGSIYVGTGAFSTTTGFATNYMWNAPNYGFVTSGIYVVPKNTIAAVYNVKYNADSTVACVFRLYGRPNRSAPWSMGASDTVNTTLSIYRTLAGTVGEGGEYTVVGQRTTNANNLQANFVLTMHELRTIYTTAGSV